MDSVQYHSSENVHVCNIKLLCSLTFNVGDFLDIFL